MPLSRAFFPGRSVTFAGLVTAVTGDGQRAPGHSLSWFESPIGSGLTASVVVRFDEGCDFELIRCLSAEAGGFAAAMESERTSFHQRVIVVYSGRVVEARTEQQDADAFKRFAQYFHGITGGLETELAWRDDIDSRTVRLSAQRSIAANRDAPLTRAAFGNVDEQTFRRAAREALESEHVEGWRWVSLVTPIASIPFVILEREGGMERNLIERLAQRCDCYAAAVSVPPESGPFQWLLVEPGSGVEYGEDEGADALIQLWKQFTLTMGEEPSLIAWPRSVRGYTLTELRAD